LKKFKHIIVIPDYDSAGCDLVYQLHIAHSNVDVKFISDIEDTSPGYVGAIKNANIMSSNKFIISNLNVEC